MSMDLRKRKSQAAIQQAILELIYEKDFEKITISDITNRADLNRGTFYLHFEDKYDMINQFEENFMKELESIMIKELHQIQNLNDLISSRYSSLVEMFDCFKNNHEILDIIFKTKGILSLQTRLNHFMDNVFTDNQLQRKQVKADFPLELFQMILVSICLGISQYWLQGNGEFSSEELAQGMLNIMINGPARAAGFISDDYIDIRNMIPQ